MRPLNQSTESIQGFFASFWDQAITIFPTVFGALLLLALGWGIAKALSYAVRKLLQSLGFDGLGRKLLVQTSLKINKDQVQPSQWIGSFVFWVVLLIFFVSASDTLGWTSVSGSISALTAYLPQLLGALLVFAVGLYIASFVRKFISTTFETLELSGGQLVSEVSFYIILFIIGTTALEQAGIETSVITANISIIIGGVLLAFAIGFGYSSRDLLTNILSSFYARNIFSEGQTIIIDNVEGTISRIDSIQTIISTKNGELIIPNKRLISESIKRIEPKTKTHVPPAIKTPRKQ